MAAASQIIPNNHYLLILCGGSGPRLWPYSRASYPKQFLNLIGTGSLLQQTIRRGLEIVPPDHVFLISNQKYVRELTRQVKGLISRRQIIAEPQKKNTAAAILYGCALINNFQPKAVISALPSDHYINRLSLYRRDLKKAALIAQRDKKIVLLGISPTRPDPSYGYLSVTPTSRPFLKVDKFTEKPDPASAARLITRGALWNSGMYTFTLDTLLQEFARYQPDYYKLFQKLEENLDRPRHIAKIYDLFPNLSIDYAISEQSANLAALIARFSWSDIGEWETIRQLIKSDPEGNALLTIDTPLAVHQSTNCLVAGTKGKLIGLVGVRDLAVIDTPDGLLVCSLKDSLSVRNLIGKITQDKNLQNYFLHKK